MDCQPNRSEAVDSVTPFLFLIVARLIVARLETFKFAERLMVTKGKGRSLCIHITITPRASNNRIFFVIVGRRSTVVKVDVGSTWTSDCIRSMNYITFFFPRNLTTLFGSCSGGKQLLYHEKRVAEEGEESRVLRGLEPTEAASVIAKSIEASLVTSNSCAVKGGLTGDNVHRVAPNNLRR